MSSSQSSSKLMVSLADSVSTENQQLFQTFVAQLPVSLAQTSNQDSIPIVAVVDGRGLACPLPLLKTKVALRDVQSGQALYVIATDPNSTADIVAFCQQNGHSNRQLKSDALALCLQCQTQTNSKPAKGTVVESTASTAESSSSSALSANSPDTFFHFIITKTDSN